MENNFKKNIEQPFGWEPNAIIFDPSISLKAKGLWLYMNSKPEGWHFAAERIAEECSDGAKGVRSALRELAEAGLLTWKKQGDGRIVYTLENKGDLVVENPDCQKVNLGTNPDCPKGKLTKGQIAKRATINNKEDNKERIIIKKEGSAGSLTASRPRRSDYESAEEYERAFYRYNRIRIGVS